MPEIFTPASNQIYKDMIARASFSLLPCLVFIIILFSSGALFATYSYADKYPVLRDMLDEEWGIYEINKRTMRESGDLAFSMYAHADKPTGLGVSLNEGEGETKEREPLLLPRMPPRTNIRG